MTTGDMKVPRLEAKGSASSVSGGHENAAEGVDSTAVSVGRDSNAKGRKLLRKCKRLKSGVMHCWWIRGP